MSEIPFFTREKSVAFPLRESRDQLDIKKYTLEGREIPYFYPEQSISSEVLHNKNSGTTILISDYQSPLKVTAFLDRIGWFVGGTIFLTIFFSAVYFFVAGPVASFLLGYFGISLNQEQILLITAVLLFFGFGAMSEHARHPDGWDPFTKPRYNH